jgi:hypothetical protein
VRVDFERDELRALSSKLLGWVVDGPEAVNLESAHDKIVQALQGVDNEKSQRGPLEEGGSG